MFTLEPVVSAVVAIPIVNVEQKPTKDITHNNAMCSSESLVNEYTK